MSVANSLAAYMLHDTTDYVIFLNDQRMEFKIQN